MPHLICSPMTSAVNREKERPLIKGVSRSLDIVLHASFNLRFNNLINLEKIKYKKFNFRVFYLAAELPFHWRPTWGSNPRPRD
jgi:hypothetical protein